MSTQYWSSVFIILNHLPDSEVKSWIICDGDIDPEWIESLNSVLDDNRLLTMPSGERIQFGPNVNFLFETHDLAAASPATISRMGMIFMRYDDCFHGSSVAIHLKKKTTRDLNGHVVIFYTFKSELTATRIRT
jgi:hypothetical protein